MMPPFTPQILVNRALIRLGGEAVLAFLHNILTCDVAELPPRVWAYGALLSPQGKIQHDLFLIHDGETVWLDCARNQRPDLLKKLLLYRLRAKITIDAVDQFAVAVGLVNGLWAMDPRLAAMGQRGVVPAVPLPPALGNAAVDYHGHRISLGLADSEADIGVNELFPHEANLDLVGGVSFTKGCYVGQEVVSRMQHRGTTRSRILCVGGDMALPPKGTEIRSGEVLLGNLLSALGTQGLALIRLDRLAGAKAPLLSETVRVRVHKPDWMNLTIDIPEVAA